MFQGGNKPLVLSIYIDDFNQPNVMKIELAHDFIAKKIYDQASIEDKARVRASRFLHDRYKHYVDSKGLLLNQQELIYIEPYTEEMDLDLGESKFIKQSRDAVKKSKFNARVKDGLMVGLICTVIVSTWGFWERHRFTNTFRALNDAQDSINILRNMVPEYSDIVDDKSADRNENFSIESSSYEPNAQNVPVELYSTINLSGIVQNEQNQPVIKAMVQVLGAEVFTDENGKFEMHLVLSPKDLKNDVQVRVSKPNFRSTSQDVDIEQTSLSLNFTLAQE